jgi:hypothetical protein
MEDSIMIRASVCALLSTVATTVPARSGDGPSPYLKDVKTIAYYGSGEPDKSRCAIDWQAWNRAIDSAANQSIHLKLIRKNDHHEKENQLADELRKANENVARKELDETRERLRRYAFAPTLSFYVLTLEHTAATVAFLANPNNSDTVGRTREMQEIARAAGRQLQVVTAATEAELEPAFAAVQRHAGALIVPPDPFFTSHREQLLALAARHAIPTSYPVREYASAGGLMSYGANLVDVYRLVGTYTGRILKGEKPADLPVQQAVKVELTINMKTAKTLGLTIPLPLLGRADEVIE